MDQRRILELIAETLEVSPDAISGETDLRAENWDSLADLIFISKIDDEFGITIDSDALGSCRSANDFVSAVLAARD